MAPNRFIMAVVFLVLTATVANAYTLVMRNGRRIEIPNEFTVTASTLTYTVGSGIQITVQLSGIDIAKTERVNGEPSGSFLARVLAPAPVCRSARANATACAALDHKPRSRRLPAHTNRKRTRLRQASQGARPVFR